jgi:hypothetical protein
VQDVRGVVADRVQWTGTRNPRVGGRYGRRDEGQSDGRQHGGSSDTHLGNFSAHGGDPYLAVVPGLEVNPSLGPVPFFPTSQVCNQRLGAFCTDLCEILALQLSQVKARATRDDFEDEFHDRRYGRGSRRRAIAQTSAEDMSEVPLLAASCFRGICAIDVTRQRERDTAF